MRSNEVVILLHGMGRTRFSMMPVCSLLHRRGFNVINLDYPSTRKNIEQLARDNLMPVVDQCTRRGATRIHFVTHSLGGIIVRQFLQNSNIPGGSRIVMLSPPNKGSEVTDTLKSNWFYRWATGPAGQQLSTAADSVPNRLGVVPAEVGVITGRRSSDPWFSALFRGENDGKVAVVRTHLDEMTDFLVVDAGHTFIMLRHDVMEQIYHFLCHGQFFRQSHKT